MSSYLDFQMKNLDKLINQISKAERQVKYISDLDSFVNKNLIGGKEKVKAAKTAEEVVLEEPKGTLLTIENISSLVKNVTKVLVGSELKFKDNELIFLEKHNEYLYFLGINIQNDRQKQLSVSIDELAKMKIFISNEEFLNTNISEKAKDFQIMYKFTPPNIPEITVNKEEIQKNLASIITSVTESIQSLKTTKVALEESKAAKAELKQKSEELKTKITNLEIKVTTLEKEIEELKKSGNENTDDIREKDNQISKLNQELTNEKRNYSQAIDRLNEVIEINKQHEEHNQELNKLFGGQ